MRFSYWMPTKLKNKNV